MRRNNPRSPSQWQWQWPQDEVIPAPCFVIGVMSNHDETMEETWGVLWCTKCLQYISDLDSILIHGRFLKPNSRTGLFGMFFLINSAPKIIHTRLPRLPWFDWLKFHFWHLSVTSTRIGPPCLEKSHQPRPQGPKTWRARKPIDFLGSCCCCCCLRLFPWWDVGLKSHKFPDHQKAATLSSDCDLPSIPSQT